MRQTPTHIKAELSLVRVESLRELADANGRRRNWTPYFHLTHDNKLLYDMITDNTNTGMLKLAIRAGQIYIPKHVKFNIEKEKKPTDDNEN